ncbi:MAG: hypothetical protein P1U35_13745 [Cycloclasticus sp.]|nr:hypothetical protein [Cycloclasticus sp.]
MFSTFVANEIHLIPSFHEEGEQFWSAITLEINKMFLQVTYQRSQDAELKKTVFLLSAEQLERLSHMDDIEISEVNLASPGSLNKTGEWRLEPLSKIYVGSEPGKNWQDIFIYLLDDGKKYIDSAMGTEEKDFTQVHCIFNKKTIRKNSPNKK